MTDRAPKPFYGAGKLQLEYFPESLIALREEIEKHPDLLIILHNQPDKDVYIQIAEIAAYCGVVLGGDYTREDIINLCDTLVKKLMSKRTIIVLPN